MASTGTVKSLNKIFYPITSIRLARDTSITSSTRYSEILFAGGYPVALTIVSGATAGLTAQINYKGWEESDFDTGWVDLTAVTGSAMFINQPIRYLRLDKGVAGDIDVSGAISIVVYNELAGIQVQ